MQLLDPVFFPLLNLYMLFIYFLPPQLKIYKMYFAVDYYNNLINVRNVRFSFGFYVPEFSSCIRKRSATEDHADSWTRKIMEWDPRDRRRGRGRPVTEWDQEMRTTCGGLVKPEWNRLGVAHCLVCGFIKIVLTETSRPLSQKKNSIRIYLI